MSYISIALRVEELQRKNPRLPMHDVNSPAFRPFGKVLTKSAEELVAYMQQTPIPADGNIYVASVPELEDLPIRRWFETHIYGGCDVQIGYCNGRNSHLNGLEYHKGSEINIAVTDFVLLLGSVQDIENNMYRSELVQAFFVPAGTILELYATTLHFAPCKVTDNGFRCVVVLPRGTNTPFSADQETGEDQLLFMKNKWLLAHPDRTVLIERGAHPGIIGENWEVTY